MTTTAGLLTGEPATNYAGVSRAAWLPAPLPGHLGGWTGVQAAGGKSGHSRSVCSAGSIGGSRMEACSRLSPSRATSAAIAPSATASAYSSRSRIRYGRSGGPTTTSAYRSELVTVGGVADLPPPATRTPSRSFPRDRVDPHGFRRRRRGVTLDAVTSRPDWSLLLLALGDSARRSFTADGGSWLSIGSRHSVLSIGSVASFGSFGSIGSVGSFASIGSAWSAMSIGSLGSFQSIGSVLSGQSRWSALSWQSDRSVLSSQAQDAVRAVRTSSRTAVD